MDEEGRRQICTGYHSEGGLVKLEGPYAEEEEEEVWLIRISTIARLKQSQPESRRGVTGWMKSLNWQTLGSCTG